MSNPRNLSSFTLIVTFVCLSLIGVVSTHQLDHNTHFLHG